MSTSGINTHHILAGFLPNLAVGLISDVSKGNRWEPSMARPRRSYWITPCHHTSLDSLSPEQEPLPSIVQDCEGL